MQHTTLPNTDLHVSRIAMGCWALAGDMNWGEQDEQASVDAVRAALDAGINFFDTAPAYGKGLSEQRLGKGLGGRRDEAVIATKLRPGRMNDDDVVESVEQSLTDLGTDRIDLLQIHWAGREVPLTETWGAMQRLRDQGKVRHLGVCNFGIGDLDELLEIDTPATDQVPYSLLSRVIEHEILPRCRERGVGVLCYGPLMMGLLTGKWMDADEVPAGRARTRHFSGNREKARHGEAGHEEETFEAVSRVREIARDSGHEMSDLAIAWVLHQSGVSGVLAGVRKPSQAARNAAAADIQLSGDLINQLNEATEPLKQALGPDPDLWQPASSTRFR